MPEQELRKDLLLFCLGKWPDLDTAVAMAVRMEQFILGGDKSGGSAESIGDDENTCAQPETSEESRRPCDAAGEAGSRAESSGLAGGQKRRWSDADDETLRRLWHSSRQLEDIAEEMDRTVPSLYCRARALGFSRRNVAPQPSAAGSASAPADQRNPAPAASVTLERYRHQQRGGNERRSQPRNGGDRGVGSPCAMPSASRAFIDEQSEFSIDRVIHFLRSRDYSVIRIEDGRFRLDGRRILSASELREKANQVRQALGQPPFAARTAEPVG